MVQRSLARRTRSLSQSVQETESSATPERYGSQSRGVMSLERIRVALFDDEPDLLKLLVRIVEHARDLEVVATGSSGRDAVHVANRTHPDVVIMDVNMPGMSGIDAAERISKGFPSIGIVLLTGQETVELVKRALRAGVMEFLAKPTSTSELLAAIRKVNGARDRMGWTRLTDRRNTDAPAGDRRSSYHRAAH